MTQTSSTHRRQNWPGIRQPALKQAIGGVILLHGLGAQADGLAAGLSMLPLPNKERITFMIPQAPTRPVTLNGGMRMPAWFDILALEDAQPQEDKEGLEQSRAIIRQLVDEMIESAVPEDKIIIGGFSQGGALAMYCLFQEMKTFAGAFSWSGYLPRGEAIPNGAGKPVLLTHGMQDPIIPYRAVRPMPQMLEDAGFRVQSHVLDGLAHSIDLRVVESSARWLGELLAAH